MLENTGAFMIPGIDTLRENVEAEMFWGRFEQQIFIGVVIDGAAIDAGNTGNTDVLRPGLLMGKVTATDKVLQYASAAIDGTEKVFGVLVYDQKMQFKGTNKDRWVGWVAVGGNWKERKIIGPGLAAYGIAGHADEAAILADTKGRVIWDYNVVGA